MVGSTAVVVVKSAVVWVVGLDRPRCAGRPRVLRVEATTAEPRSKATVRRSVVDPGPAGIARVRMGDCASRALAWEANFPLAGAGAWRGDREGVPSASRLGVGGAELDRGRGVPQFIPASFASASFASASLPCSTGESASGWNRLGLPGVAIRAWRRVTTASGTVARADAPRPAPRRLGMPGGPGAEMGGPGIVTSTRG